MPPVERIEAKNEETQQIIIRFVSLMAVSLSKQTLTSESLNNSGMNPSKKQPTNIATDIRVIVSPPSMVTTYF